MPIIVYVDMVADLFHLGHVEFLRKAREYGDVLKVGIHNDETVEGYKRTPICNMDERIAVIAACRYVDEVIPNAPLRVTKDYLTEHGIDIVVHADDLTNESTLQMYGDVIDVLHFVPYTSGISTTAIIHRLAPHQNVKSHQFRQLLRSSTEPSILMEAHSGLSAKIVENAGFKGIWGSGLSISASLGLRDANEASWTQVLDVVAYMRNASSLPILLDGDTGYGNFNNARLLVRQLDQMGVAGVCIEDKIFPKTNSFIDGAQELANIDEFCGKIRACKDSQLSTDFVVVARVEAFISGAGLDEALKRASAYERAGADAILIHSKKDTPIEIRSFLCEWRRTPRRIPVIIVPTTYFTSYEDLATLGASMMIFANHNVRASITAMEAVCKQIADTRCIHGLSHIASVRHIFELQNEAELSAAEKMYLPA